MYTDFHDMQIFAGGWRKYGAEQAYKTWKESFQNDPPQSEDDWWTKDEMGM